MHQSIPLAIAIVPLVIVAIVAFGSMAYLSRRGFLGQGGSVIVRCLQGHLFTTVWVPGVSLKAIRFGLTRYQRCPIGNHMTLVTPVDPATLTDEQRAFAYQHRDTNIP